MTIALTSFDWGIAVYVASTIHEDASRSAELHRRLTNLGASPELLENIRRGAGTWSVSDDDHTDVIVSYAAKFSRASGSVDGRDIERLVALGFTREVIAELNVAMAFVDYATHPG